MSHEGRLALVNVKVERAKHHIRDLHELLRAFHATNPYELGRKRNPETRQLVYYLTRADPIPAGVATIAGDAIQNLRSALDHLVQQMWFVNTPGASLGSRDISFPTDRSADQFKTSFQGKVKGLRQDAIDLLLATEPYDGGKGAGLSILNRLNRIDKHRSLLTAYVQPSVDVSADIAAFAPGLAHVVAAFASKGLLFFEHIASPVQVGSELYVRAPDAPENENRKIRLEIAFNEPGVVQGKPVVETIQHLSDLVSATIQSFSGCLK